MVTTVLITLVILSAPVWFRAAAWNSRGTMAYSSRRSTGSGKAPVGVALSALVVFAAFLTPMAIGQDRAEADQNPLAPANTESPRDTLQSFLDDMGEVLDTSVKYGEDPEIFHAYLRALDTLDFSTLSDSDSWVVRTRQLCYLMEILNRIEIPPFDEIPGRQEVRQDKITRWMIPETRITIELIEEGPQADEFLFSASTVEELERYYLEVKDLPYKPGTTHGALEKVLNLYDEELAADSEMRSHLKPIDKSSPRSTLNGLLSSVNQAYVIIMEAHEALKADPPTMTREEVIAHGIKATNLLNRAVSTLDLSQVPEALREDVGIESVLQLKEIFDRGQLPPIDSIPDAEMIADARTAAGGGFGGMTLPIRWRYPNTEIEIVEIVEGEQQGQFLFSAATVDRIDAFYDKIAHLPYREDPSSVVTSQYASADKSPGFYEFYITTPGYMIPLAHFMGKLVDCFPDWLKAIYGGQTVWQWIAFVLCLLILLGASVLTFKVIRGLANRLSTPLSYWVKLTPPAGIAMMIFLVIRFLNKDVNITGAVLGYVSITGRFLVLLMAGWVVIAICKAIAESIIASPKIAPESLDASLLRIAARLVGFLLGAWILVKGIQTLGADVVPLLAGLGVGGLAVALAAQRTFANLIGSLILFLNKPVRVGDFCKFGSEMGTVEQIGLLSTRIRSRKRTILTVPNAEFSEMMLENYAKRDEMLINLVLDLRYETTPEQLRYVLAKLRELLLAHPKVTVDPSRVRFVGFGDVSLKVEIFAYVSTQDWETFLGIQEDIYLRMMDIVEESGSGFAFPSQTLYLSRDTGLDHKKQEEAISEVQKWRDQHKLPFPNFDAGFKETHRDSLDYPPAGSVDADRNGEGK